MILIAARVASSRSVIASSRPSGVSGTASGQASRNCAAASAAAFLRSANSAFWSLIGRTACSMRANGNAVTLFACSAQNARVAWSRRPGAACTSRAGGVAHVGALVVRALIGVVDVRCAVGKEDAVVEVVIGVGPVGRLIGVGPERVVENVRVGVGPVHRPAPRHIGGAPSLPPGRRRRETPGALEAARAAVGVGEARREPFAHRPLRRHARGAVRALLVARERRRRRLQSLHALEPAQLAAIRTAETATLGALLQALEPILRGGLALLGAVGGAVGRALLALLHTFGGAVLALLHTFRGALARGDPRLRRLLLAQRAPLRTVHGRGPRARVNVRRRPRRRRDPRGALRCGVARRHGMADRRRVTRHRALRHRPLRHGARGGRRPRHHVRPRRRRAWRCHMRRRSRAGHRCGRRGSSPAMPATAVPTSAVSASATTAGSASFPRVGRCRTDERRYSDDGDGKGCDIGARAKHRCNSGTPPKR